MHREGEVITACCCRAVPASSRDGEQDCIWGAFSEQQVQKVTRDESQAKERGLEGPIFCCDLEEHLFGEHFKDLQVMVRNIQGFCWASELLWLDES